MSCFKEFLNPVFTNTVCAKDPGSSQCNVRLFLCTKIYIIMVLQYVYILSECALQY